MAFAIQGGIKIKKSLFSAVFAIAVFVIMSTVTFAAAVSPSSSAVLIDGAPKSVAVYNIGGYNYFKLRDLAMLLNGTKKQFDVGYDNESRAITLTSGKAYTSAGGELASAGGAENAVPTASRIFADNRELALTVYNIGGNNYFMLRDIAEVVDCGVTYDEATGNIGLDTSAGYVAPATPVQSTPAAPAGSPAQAIITETPTIGGSKANLVYIPMGGGRKGTVVTANGNVTSDQNAQELINRAPGKAVAAINGGFFASYYNAGKAMAFPDNYPEIYGAVMQNGRIINATGQANALAFDDGGKPYIDRVDIKTNIVIKKADGDKEFTVWGVNKYYTDEGSINLFTPEFALSFTTKADAKVVSIKDGKVASIADGGSYTVPAGTSVAVFNAGAAANASQWGSFPSVGDSAEIAYEFVPKKGGDDWNKMSTIVAGGRMILQNGVSVTTDDSYNAGIDDPKQSASSKQQRSFAAVMDDGRLVLGTVNASFNDIAAYLKTKGATDAVSLDGGASSMLYVDGKGFLTKAGRKLASAVVIFE